MNSGLIMSDGPPPISSSSSSSRPPFHPVTAAGKQMRTVAQDTDDFVATNNNNLFSPVTSSSSGSSGTSSGSVKVTKSYLPPTISSSGTASSAGSGGGSGIPGVSSSMPSFTFTPVVRPQLQVGGVGSRGGVVEEEITVPHQTLAQSYYDQFCKIIQGQDPAFDPTRGLYFEVETGYYYYFDASGHQIEGDFHQWGFGRDAVRDESERGFFLKGLAALGVPSRKGKISGGVPMSSPFLSKPIDVTPIEQTPLNFATYREGLNTAEKEKQLNDNLTKMGDVLEEGDQAGAKIPNYTKADYISKKDKIYANYQALTKATKDEIDALEKETAVTPDPYKSSLIGILKKVERDLEQMDLVSVCVAASTRNKGLLVDQESASAQAICNTLYHQHASKQPTIEKVAQVGRWLSKESTYFAPNPEAFCYAARAGSMAISNKPARQAFLKSQEAELKRIIQEDLFGGLHGIKAFVLRTSDAEKNKEVDQEFEKYRSKFENPPDTLAEKLFLEVAPRPLGETLNGSLQKDYGLQNAAVRRAIMEPAARVWQYPI